MSCRFLAIKLTALKLSLSTVGSMVSGAENVEFFLRVAF
jgi:hypothetical protein